MSDFALDANGDLEVVLGETRLCTSEEAVAQDWKLRMGMWRGEWFVDQRVGIDYPNSILVKNPRTELLRSIFRKVTIETAGIKDILSLDFELNSKARTLNVTIEALFDSGATGPLVYKDVLLDDVQAVAR